MKFGEIAKIGISVKRINAFEQNPNQQRTQHRLRGGVVNTENSLKYYFLFSFHTVVAFYFVK